MHSINRYAEMRQESARVGERPLFALPKTPNELELQARWFAGEFGRKFQTLTGEPVEIVYNLVFGITRPVPTFRTLLSG